MDAGNGSAPLMLPISEIARMKGVSQPAITKRVKRLEEQGLLATVSDRGRKLVPLAEYDRLVAETTDFSKVRRAVEIEAATVMPPGPGDEIVRAREDARTAKYNADMRQIALQEKLGHILLLGDVEQAMTRCAEAMVRRIDQLSVLAEDMAAAVAKSGSDGARDLLKHAARELRQALADAMKLLVEETDQEEDDTRNDPTNS